MEKSIRATIIFFISLLIINLLFFINPNIWIFSLLLLPFFVYFSTAIPLGFGLVRIPKESFFIILFFSIMTEYIYTFGDFNSLNVLYLGYLLLLRFIFITYLISSIIKYFFDQIFKKGINFPRFYPKDKSELEKEDNMWISIVSFLQGFLSISIFNDTYKFMILLGMLCFNIPRAIGHIKNNSCYRLLSVLIILLVSFYDVYIIITQILPTIDIIKIITQNKDIYLYMIDVSIVIIVAIIIGIIYSIFEKRYTYSIP